MMLRGQAGLEYAGLLVLILVALSPVFYFSLVQVQSSAALSTARSAVAQLAAAADSAAVAGEGSISSVRVTFPEFVENSSATHAAGKEIALALQLPTGRTEVYAVTRSNVTGILPLTPGRHSFNVTVLGSGIVNVTELP